jgi:hypothetical protein
MPSLSWFSRERFAVALLFSGLLLAACLMPAQSDTWWQLRSGEEMWRTGRVMLRDEFTHTVAGEPWPNHEWLSHVLFYLLFALGGLPLLTAFCAAAVTLAWAIAFRLTPGPVLLRVAAVGLGAFLSSPAWCLRPQVLTLAMTAVTLLILVRRRYMWTLPGLFLLWANLHGAVALGGVIVVAAWLACAVRDRGALPAYSAILVLCFLATAVTPMGTSLWLEIPQSLQRLQNYDVIEWRAPSLTSLRDLPFWGIAAAAGALAWTGRRRISAVPTLTLTLSTAALFILATRSMRNVAPFMIAAMPTIATLLRVSPALRRQTRPGPALLALNAITLAIVLLAGAAGVAFAWGSPLPRLGWQPVLPETIAAIRSCPGRLYNRYDEGGYLIWFVRDRKVFIDSRQDPFPEPLVRAHIDLERSGEYQALFARYDIGCALSAAGTPLAHSLERDGWSPLDAGGGWRVYQKPGRRSSVDARPPQSAVRAGAFQSVH